MPEKKLDVRIVHKHDIESNWDKAVNFIPKKAELIVYDADENYDYIRVKMGDGVTNVSELPFLDDEIYNELDQKQNVLTFDNTPTSNSNNPVKSSGVKTYVDNKFANTYKFKGTIGNLSFISSLSSCEQGSVYNYIGETRTISQPYLGIPYLINILAQVDNDYEGKAGIQISADEAIIFYEGLSVTLGGEVSINDTVYKISFVDDSTSSSNGTAWIWFTNTTTFGGTVSYIQTSPQITINKGDNIILLNVASNVFIDKFADISGCQEKLTFDTVPTANSTNPVTSGGIKSSLDNKASTTWVSEELDTKQDVLTFDDLPVLNSENPVTSDGIKSTINELKYKSIPHTIVSGYPVELNSILYGENLLSCKIYGSEDGVGELQQDNSYKIDVCVKGENLYDEDIYLDTDNWDGYNSQITYPAGTYTISYDYVSTSTATAYIDIRYLDNTVCESHIFSQSMATGNHSVTFTATETWRMFVYYNGTPSYSQLVTLFTTYLNNIVIELDDIKRTISVYNDTQLFENDYIEVDNVPVINSKTNIIYTNTTNEPDKIEVEYYQDINKIIGDINDCLELLHKYSQNLINTKIVDDILALQRTYGGE